MISTPSTIVLLLSIIILQNSFCTVTQRRCPARCTIYNIERNELSRIKTECSTSDLFVKCSASVWRTATGALQISFEGDSSAQAINESTIPSISKDLFYHHTQINFYGNVTETRVNIRSVCFDTDDCSRSLAVKYARQLLEISFSELEKDLRPLLYDPVPNTENEFYTKDLKCANKVTDSLISCNTTCYVSLPFAPEQPSCWYGTTVGFHAYTKYNLPAANKTDITLSYNCNVRSNICNGQDVFSNITTTVQNFFQDPPITPILNGATKYNTNCFNCIIQIVAPILIVYQTL